MDNLTFQIGRHLGEDRWTQIGRAIGPDRGSAFGHWVEQKHVEPGEYGIRLKGEAAWTCFVVDQAGIHSVDAF